MYNNAHNKEITVKRLFPDFLLLWKTLVIHLMSTYSYLAYLFILDKFAIFYI